MDAESSSQSSYISLFDLSPSTFPFRSPRPREIETRRANLSDLLIFDILLSTGGIRQPDTLYPPTDTESLRRLLDAIDASSYDVLKKDCLVYFLLKWHEDGREERFQEERCLPPQFVALADAYWHLDSGIDVPKAVSILSDARLNRDYASKIIQAISLDPHPSPLIVRYVRTAKPLLTEPDDIDTYTLALAQSSLLEAWQFQRTFPEGGDTRSRLLRKILDWCLSPRPRPKPLAQLLAFPFSPYEQSQVHAYALQPSSTCSPASIPIVQDLVCVRLIQSGSYAAAVKLDRQFAVVHGGDKIAQDRRRMMDDIVATMPAVERELLEVELEEISRGSGAVATKDLSMSLSGSWEDLGTRANGSAKVPPISERAGAPRFGGSTPMPAINGKAKALASPAPAFVPVPVTVSAVQSQPHSFSTSTHKPPILSSSGIKPSRFVPTVPSQASPSGVTASLFDSSRSANATRNAFYEPPPTANGRTTSTVGKSIEAAAHQPPNGVEDVDMESDNDFVVSRRNRAQEKEEDEGIAPPAELSFSLFSNGGPPVSNGPYYGSKRLTRAETEGKMPPGAFVSEPEEERPWARSSTRRRASPSPPPQPAPPKATRNMRTRKESDLGRSLPGSLMGPEEEEEEEDNVAPLPPSPPTKRKARASRATSEELVKPRRSTRLSAASSSPEPLTPPKGKSRKSKSSTSGATAVGAAVKSRTSKRRS